jgi:hypothetical protein
VIRRPGVIEQRQALTSDTPELTVDGPHGARTVRVSHPERVYFPELGVVKADVVRYFLSVGEGCSRHCMNGRSRRRHGPWGLAGQSGERASSLRQG